MNTKHKRLSTALLACALPLLTALPARAHGEVANPAASANGDDQQSLLLKQVKFDQKLNAQIPLNARFRDDNGREVAFGSVLRGKPVVMALIYYRCTMLCSEVLNATMRSLKELNFEAGKDYDVVMVSIAPREKPKDALQEKQARLKEYGRGANGEGWHFLTGQESEVKKVANAVGFGYAYDPSIKEYAHPNGILIVTPQGRVSHYFYGLEYPSKDVKFGLIEASQGKIGSPVDQLLLTCFHYNPVTGKYSLAITSVLRLASILLVVSALGGIGLAVRREKRARPDIADASIEGQVTPAA